VDSEGKLVVNLTRGNVVCDDVAIADRARRRMRGLLGRDSLDLGAGMLLQPAPSIHTAFMHFTIDAVFMDGTLRVKKIVRGLRPWRVASARRAWGVLEVAEGEVERRGVALGDQLGVVQVTDELGAIENKSAWHRWNWTPIENTQEEETANGAAMNGASHLRDRHAAPTDGLQGTRVLVVGSDRRFRSVAAALLTRRGCAVSLSDRSASLAGVIRSEQAEVVVLDASLSLTRAAHRAAQIEALKLPVGLVLVGEEPEQGLATMPVLPKWGSFDQLYDAIERARPGRTLRVLDGGVS
jgi:uncharacterized protein